MTIISPGRMTCKYGTWGPGGSRKYLLNFVDAPGPSRDSWKDWTSTSHKRKTRFQQIIFQDPWFSRFHLIPCYALQMGIIIIIIILHHPPSRTSRTSNKCIRIPKNMLFKKKLNLSGSPSELSWIRRPSVRCAAVSLHLDWWWGFISSRWCLRSLEMS